ncbi:MAG TPA: 1-deoxy-D-xylulose-5-phosphate reductoisomerase [Candidatus Kapabacteria bacterium]|nr:1-deoxy-D-xylulose-5-phosphate reductoisomerase [Candidatus Kapabacteria bacterium]
MQQITILGSTGSIGVQTLDVIRSNPDRYRAAYLTSNVNIDRLERQVAEFAPDGVVVSDPEQAAEARRRFGDRVEVLEGDEALASVAADPAVDIVMSALVGFAGLQPTIAAVRAGKRVALANKETMVVAGELINRLRAEHGATIIPVDSEHSAIFQCLVGEEPSSIGRLVLTASGGPFRELPAESFGAITAIEALRHPNWSMGPKITIDSATLMNKGLEVIEARWLFDIGAERVDVVVHPQSIIHSMVEFVDGSVKAQLGLPDMRLPIQYAMAYPERIAASYGRLDLASVGTLSFFEPDTERFPALRLAYAALERGGTAPSVLNAANEIAVAAFLAEEIAFPQISALIERALSEASIAEDPSLVNILEADKRTREAVRSYLGSRSFTPPS